MVSCAPRPSTACRRPPTRPLWPACPGSARAGSWPSWPSARPGTPGRPSWRGRSGRRPEGGPRPEADEWARGGRAPGRAGQWERCRRAGIAVCWPGSPGYPAVLGQGPAPAGVLFSAGRWTASGSAAAWPSSVPAGAPRREPTSPTGWVTTSRPPACAWSRGWRSASTGRPTPGRWRREARPSGAVAAMPAVRVGGTVGVAASGVDVVYPRQHAGLWREMVRMGAILSETPPGHPAQAWRFPSRNRLIAGLAEMVVVVECHAKGGSWHTVEAATKTGRRRRRRTGVGAQRGVGGYQPPPARGGHARPGRPGRPRRPRHLRRVDRVDSPGAGGPDCAPWTRSSWPPSAGDRCAWTRSSSAADCP